MPTFEQFAEFLSNAIANWNWQQCVVQYLPWALAWAILWVGNRIIGAHLPVREFAQAVLDRMAKIEAWELIPQSKGIYGYKTSLNGTGLNYSPKTRNLYFDGEDPEKFCNRYERRRLRQAGLVLYKAIAAREKAAAEKETQREIDKLTAALKAKVTKVVA